MTARPGSGKTFTLVRMIAREAATLLSYQGIIAISYTNKASDELRDRCDSLGIERDRSFFGTIDKFCIGQIIAPFATHVTEHLESLVLVEDDTCEEWKALAGKKYDDPELKAFLMNALSSGELPIGALGPATLYILDVVPQASIFIRSRYKSIYIDEYQDCGLYQHLLMKRLISYGLRGVAVGDIDQAIFRFADKSPEYLSELIKLTGFEHFRITENYRCDKAIQDYSLALLGIPAGPIAPENRRVFAIHKRGDEVDLAEAIGSHIQPVMRKYGVDDCSRIALIGSSNAVLDIYASSIGIPSKRYIGTPLDSGFSKWRRVFSDLLISYYDIFHYSGAFLDRHIGPDAKPSKRNHGIALLDEYYALPEEDLCANIDLAIAIAELCNSGKEHDGDIEAYRKVVEDIQLMRSGFRPAQHGEINILTYHKAKGLEFDIVFCLEAYRFIMPPLRYDEMSFDAYGQSLAMHYVGITRAKKVCYILLGSKRHNKNGDLKVAEPSEFLSLSGLRELRIESCWDLPIQ